MDLQKFKPKPSKRQDLQGIRGLAILSVLGFHFLPGTFPNGYLGVDQFFVLSGFLMCMLLKRAEDQSPFSLITLFYSKRFKRILPLYLLIILISMIFLYNFFPATAIETNRSSAVMSLLFVSNKPMTIEEDYFEMLAIAVNIFTHTWSLSVEIQFYLIVPSIYIIGNKIPQKLQYGYYGVIGLFSIGYYYSSPATVAFNSMLVYGASQAKISSESSSVGDKEPLLSDEESQDVERNPTNVSKDIIEKTSSYILILTLVFITTCPFSLSSDFGRPLITIGTGLLMLISSGNQFLSNRVLTYIGDISYSLYLIHWPIYAYWKLTYGGDSYLLIVALAASCILAVISFEGFEKWYLHLSLTNIGVLVVTLFLLNVIVINKDDILDRVHLRTNSNRDIVTSNMTVDDAIRLNYQWTVRDYVNFYTPTCKYAGTKNSERWCRHTGLQDSGKYKMVIFGNSWADNHATLFYQECHAKTKSILQGCSFGCEPLYPFEISKNCEPASTLFEQQIKNEQPDYAFLFTRFMNIGHPIQKTIEEDPIYLIMKKKMLGFISNIKYKLYILDAIPRVHRETVSRIAPLVKEGKDLAEIDTLLNDFIDYEAARTRHAQLLKDCQGKCALVDYLPEFYNNSTRTFRFFDDKGFSYLTEENHLSPHGLEHVRHVWTDICNNL
eukprot:NP_493309.2 O-ACyltransferase homolog [Caenorhabditis elegans]